MSKGRSVGTLPGYGRLSWPAFSTLCQPHHHVNHIIIQQLGSVTVRKHVSSGLKDSRAQYPAFFPVKWLPSSPKQGLCFRGCGPRSAKVVDKKCTGPLRELDLIRFALENAKKNVTLGQEHVGKMEDEVDKMRTRLQQELNFIRKSSKINLFGTFFEDGVGKMCTRLQRELDFTQYTEQLWICVVESARQNAHETVARDRAHIKMS